ncbi:MAG: methyl-accepting chemotaxis protein [Clostridia bacterium]
MKEGLGTHSIRFKLTLSFAIIMIIFAVIVGYEGYREAKKELTKAGITDLTHLISGSVATIEALNRQVAAGELALEEAQEIAREILNGPILSGKARDLNKVNVKYGNDGYIFALDSRKTMKMHPLLQDNDMNGIMSKDGKVDFIKQLTADKQGIMQAHYLWNNKEGEALREKIALSQYYEPWDWFIAVSAYSDEFEANARQVAIALILPISIMSIAGILILFLIIIRFTRPIIYSSNAMQKFANGDLTYSVETKGRDEISQLGEYINTASVKLSEMLGQVTKTADEVAVHAQNLNKNADESSRAIEQVAQTVENVAQGASEQANAAQKGAEMIQGLDCEIKKVSENSETLANSAMTLRQSREQGIQSVEILRDRSDRSNQAAGRVVQGIDRLNNKSQEIGQISTVISGVAEQTNLLALNAAIEAARAGEQGRGFAVVAEEIRKLAEQSQRSAKDINQLIQEVQNEIQVNNSVMGEVKTVVVEQIDAVKETEKAFDNIAKISEEIVQQIEAIAGSINYMEEDSQKIVDVINDISAVSEQSAAAAQEVAASTEEQIASVQEISSSVDILAKMADDLRQLTKQFKLR